MNVRTQKFDEYGPGSPLLMRVDDEGVPKIVQSMVAEDDVLIVDLFDGSRVCLSTYQSGGMFLGLSDHTYYRAEEILLRHWAAFVKARKVRIDTEPLYQDKGTSHDLH